MIPDPTQIAAGAALVESGTTSYPIILVIFGIVVVVGAAVYVFRRLRRVIPGG